MIYVREQNVDASIILFKGIDIFSNENPFSSFNIKSKYSKNKNNFSVFAPLINKLKEVEDIVSLLGEGNNVINKKIAKRNEVKISELFSHCKNLKLSTNELMDSLDEINALNYEIDTIKEDIEITKECINKIKKYEVINYNIETNTDNQINYFEKEIVDSSNRLERINSEKNSINDNIVMLLEVIESHIDKIVNVYNLILNTYRNELKYSERSNEELISDFVMPSEFIKQEIKNNDAIYLGYFDIKKSDKENWIDIISDLHKNDVINNQTKSKLISKINKANNEFDLIVGNQLMNVGVKRIIYHKSIQNYIKNPNDFIEVSI